MKVFAYRKPIKGKEDDFQLIEEFVPLQFITYTLGRGHYSLLEKIASNYFKYYKSALKDEKTELILIGSGKKPIDDKSVKGAISDVIYQNKIIEVDVIQAVSSLIFTLSAGHWWIKYGLPGLMLLFTSMAGYTSGTWVDLLLASWLMKGREYAVEKSMEKWSNEYLEKVKEGVRKTYKKINNIREIEHPGIGILRKMIENENNKTEAYIKALHLTGKLGLPQFRSFYSYNAPITEWEINEVGTTFNVFEKPPVEPKFEFKKTTYETTYQRLRDEEMELFDYNLKPKFLSQNKTFDDWYKHVREVAKNLGAEEITVYTTRRGKPVNFYAIGDRRAPFKFLVKGGHEDEFRYLPAIYQMMASFLKEGKLTNDVLRKVRIYFLLCDDPDGFDMRAWTAVDMEGKEVHWPPEYFSMHAGSEYRPIFTPPLTRKKEDLMDFAKRLIAKDVTKNICTNAGRIYRDENGVYGDEIRSERILSIQQFIHEEIRPHVAVDLHETVRGASSYLVYENAGILEIGHYQIRDEILEKIYNETKKKKPYTLTGYLSIVPKIKRLLKNNPGFELGAAMMENVKKKGFKTYGGEFQALLEAPSLLPQIIAVDTGRSVWGWVGKDAEISVCPDWLMKNYGTLAYTTETFPNPLWEVVGEDMAYVEGGLKYIVKRW